MSCPDPKSRPFIRRQRTPANVPRPSLSARLFALYPRRSLMAPRLASPLRMAAGAAAVCLLALLLVGLPAHTPGTSDAGAPLAHQVEEAELDAGDIGLTDIAQDPGRNLLALDRVVPEKPEEAQKRPPCDPEMGETTINHACYVVVATMKPPCGKLYRWGDACVRPVLVGQRTPNTIDGGSPR